MNAKIMPGKKILDSIQCSTPVRLDALSKTQMVRWKIKK